MEKEDIRDILERAATGRLSETEEAKAKLWLWELNQQGSAGLSDEDMELASGRIWNRLETGRAKVPVVSRKLWPRWLAAASVLLMLGLGLWFYQRSGVVSDGDLANDVAPGRQAATLTLSDGRKILLADAFKGSIAQEAGVRISKTADGELVYEVVGNDESGKNLMQQLSTYRGETQLVLLPDGSKVWLNAESSLKYPAGFAARGKREVAVSGEAYFEVAHDPSRPFVVTGGGQQVEVLGTHFNINTYSAGVVETTLAEGSVRVAKGDVSKVIRPGEQVLAGADGLKVREADLEQVLGWKEGNFVFSGEDIRGVMVQLERWYDVQVVYEGNLPEGVFYANISRNKNISQVLRVLEKTGGVHFKIQGRRIMVGK